MKLAWLTDIHLDHLWHRDEWCKSVPDKVVKFCETLKDSDHDAIIISGDISMAGHNYIKNFFLTTEFCVKYLHKITKKPVYFILGNHDYYFSSVDDVRQKMKDINETHTNLKWLTGGPVIELSPKIALLGHDGWYDMRNGEMDGNIILREFVHCSTFGISTEHCVKTARGLADEASDYFARVLPRVFEMYDKAILLTHVPPFVEASRYRGYAPTPYNLLPFYSSFTIGQTLSTLMKEHPEKELLVLSGHTHGEADEQILPNLRVMVGRAKYGFPTIQNEIEVVGSHISVH